MSINEHDRDLEIEALLAPIDPGHRDETYWPRFQRTVIARALDELAHRKVIADLTVAELMSSWARTLVPTAVTAAAVAGFFLVRPAVADSDDRLVAVEEALVEGIEGEAIPDVLGDDELPDAGGAVFASEIF